jgi:hypothetical protein
MTSNPFFIECVFGGHRAEFPVFNCPQLYTGVRQILNMIFLSTRSGPADFDLLAMGRVMQNDDDLMDAMGQAFSLTGLRKLQVYLQVFESDEQPYVAPVTIPANNSYTPTAASPHSQLAPSPVHSAPSPAAVSAPASAPAPVSVAVSAPSSPSAVNEDSIKSAIARYFDANVQWDAKKFLPAQALTDVRTYLVQTEKFPDGALNAFDINGFSREIFFDVKKSRLPK